MVVNNGFLNQWYISTEIVCKFSAPPRPKTGICGFYHDAGAALRAVRASSQGAQKIFGGGVVQVSP
jgi:hypothetical protein